MRTILRKIRADILSRKGRSLLVIASVLVGVLGVTLLVGVGDIISRQLESDLQPDKLPMIRVWLDLPSGQMTASDNQQLIDNLKGLPDVTAVEGQAIYGVEWRKPDNNTTIIDGVLIAYTQPFGQIQLEPPTRVLEGHYPNSGEIAVERRLAEEFSISLGDKLIFGRDMEQGTPREWEVVGIVYAPYTALEVDATEAIFVNYDDAQEISGFGGLSAVVARYSSFSAAQAGERDFLHTFTQSSYVVEGTVIEDPTDTQKMREVADITNIMNILGIAAMVVSGFLVTNVINTIVVEQRRQIGVIKTLGASRTDSFLLYAGMAFVYGVVGTILGIALAIPLSSWLAHDLADFAETYLEGFQISVEGIGVGFVMGLLLPVVVSVVPVFNATRVSILEAITDMGITSKWGSGPLSRFIRLLPMPITVRQAFSNVVQKRGRLVLTLITLSLAAGVFMGVIAAFSAVGGIIDQVYAAFNYDLIVFPNQAQNYPEFENLLQDNVQGVSEVCPAFSVSIGVPGYLSAENSSQLSALGIDPNDSPITLKLTEGHVWRDDTPPLSVIISDQLAEQLDKQAGDSIILTGGGQTFESLIIGIDDISFDVLFFQWDELAAAAGYVDGAGNPQPNAVYVQLSGDTGTVEDVDGKILEIETFLSGQGVSAGFENRIADEDEIRDLMDNFNNLFQIAAIVLAAVGAVGLTAVLWMSVMERQKEIGVMRSIGAQSWIIGSQFLTEGLLIGLIAWMVGLPISFLLATILIDSLPVSTTIEFIYPLSAPMVGLMGILIFATIASLLPSITAARKTVSDILRYQ